MDKLKLKWRIFLFFLVFSGLLLGVLWLFQTVFLNDMYKFIRKKEMNNAIILVEKNINSLDLQSIIKQLEIEKEILVMPTNEFAPQKAWPNNEIRVPNKINKRQNEAIAQTKEFKLLDGDILSLTFYALITPVDATVSTLKIQLYIITGFMVILSIALAAIISKHISRPIEEINHSAKYLAIGNYDVEFNGKGFLEVEQLSKTLNTATKELSEVERLRKELLANVSHDLRTPLALIYSYSEMMHDFPQDINEENIQIIMDETKRLTSLVNDVMDISKYENGNQSLEKTKYNLTLCIKEIIYRLSEMLKDKEYIINFEYEEEVTVVADKSKINQVIYNLLINAVNYSNNKSPIIVKQTVENSNVVVCIIDKGYGIEEDLIPYIWDRYYRNKDNHTRAIAGSGLGLSIVKKVISSHEGECGVKSKIGEGSTFWFSLKI